MVVGTRKGKSSLTPWKGKNLLFVDTETTGLGADAEVVELAAMLLPWNNEKETYEIGSEPRTFQTYVMPCLPVPKEATAVHGIRKGEKGGDYLVQSGMEGEHEIRNCPRLNEVMDFLLFFEDTIWVAYNAPYDFGILTRELHHDMVRRQEELPLHSAWQTSDGTPQWIDPLPWVWERDAFVAGKGRYKLGAVAERWGIPIRQAHSALSDVETTIAVFQKLFSEGVFPDSLEELLMRQKWLRAAHEEGLFRHKLEEMGGIAASMTAATSGTFGRRRFPMRQSQTRERVVMTPLEQALRAKLRGG